jgi:hypothetical protein
MIDRAKSYRDKAKISFAMAQNASSPDQYIELALQYLQLAKAEEARPPNEKPITAIAAYLGRRWDSKP